MASNIPYELLQQGIPQINPSAAGQIGISGINSAINAQGQAQQAAQAQAQIEAQMQMQRQALAAQQQREEAQRQFQMQQMQQQEALKQQLAQEMTQREYGVANTKGGYDIQKEVIRAQQKAAEQKQHLMLGLMQENRLGTSTDFLRNLAAAGIDPTSEQGKLLLNSYVNKGNKTPSPGQGKAYYDPNRPELGEYTLPGATVSGETARTLGQADTILNSAKMFRDLEDQGKLGYFDTTLAQSSLVPQFARTQAQQDIKYATDSLTSNLVYLKSGAAVTEAEFKRLGNLAPVPGDTAQTRKNKLDQLEKELKVIVERSAGKTRDQLISENAARSGKPIDEYKKWSGAGEGVPGVPIIKGATSAPAIGKGDTWNREKGVFE